jgi:hypothetical protein
MKNIYIKTKYATKSCDFNLNFPSTENQLTLPFVAENDGIIYKVESTNIASYTINGVPITLPYSIVGGTVYLITITKTTNGQLASIKLKTRRVSNKNVEINVPVTLSENIQGTKSYYIHSLDNKMTIIDSSLINDSNYLGGISWTTSPKTVIDLPTTTGILWEAFCYDNISDRIIIFARNTVTNTQFHICALHINGAKANQIWNLQGTVQNELNTININPSTFIATIYPIIDYNNSKIHLFSSYRQYDGDLINNFLTWSINNDNQSLFRNGNVLFENLVRKFNYSFAKSKFVTHTCFQRASVDYTRINNFFINYENDSASVGLDNISENVFKSRDSVMNLFVFNGNIQIATISGKFYRSRRMISASVKRRMIVARQDNNADHPQCINLLNLDSKTLIRTENVFTDADVVNCKDGDYLNSIDKFAFLSDGTTGQGKRIVYFISSDYDGVNNLLKYKVLLDYDSTFMGTNRIRY